MGRIGHQCAGSAEESLPSSHGRASPESSAARSLQISVRKTQAVMVMAVGRVVARSAMIAATVVPAKAEFTGSQHTLLGGLLGPFFERIHYLDEQLAALGKARCINDERLARSVVLPLEGP